MSAAGSVTVTPYFRVGDAGQVTGYGFGTGRWGGETFPIASNTLDGALLNDSAGTGGSGTTITLDSTANFFIFVLVFIIYVYLSFFQVPFL